MWSREVLRMVGMSDVGAPNALPADTGVSLDASEREP